MRIASTNMRVPLLPPLPGVPVRRGPEGALDGPHAARHRHAAARGEAQQTGRKRRLSFSLCHCTFNVMLSFAEHNLVDPVHTVFLLNICFILSKSPHAGGPGLHPAPAQALQPPRAPQDRRRRRGRRGGRRGRRARRRHLQGRGREEEGGRESSGGGGGRRGRQRGL
jgi:hypothetical protein